VGPAADITPAPVRVNALSPGIVDSGAWDRMGEEKDRFSPTPPQIRPASRRRHCWHRPTLTGTTVHIDVGGRLV
jgi:hypothetical protein